MSNIGKSFSREIGKNTGKVVSNLIFGDLWSTPYRRTDKAKEARAEAIQAKISIKQKEQICAIDSAVLQNIDSVAGYRFSNDKANLINQLSELAIQLKANKWHNVTEGDEQKKEEAKVRNKYCDALFEKYKQGLSTLKTIDPDEPQIDYFEKIKKRTTFGKLIRKYQYFVLIISLLIVIAILIFICALDEMEESKRNITLIISATSIITLISTIIYFKIRKNKKKKEKHALYYQSKQNNYTQTEQKFQTSNIESEAIKNSVFIDLNNNNRIESKLNEIWSKYNNKVDKQILNRKPIFSADGVKDSILFVGVNPSYNPNDDNILLNSVDNKSLMYGSLYQLPDAPQYFKILEEFASQIGKAYTQINLLYARENDRNLLLKCDHNFIREQLELTYDTILKIEPIAIVFFSDYCKEMIFGADRWINPNTEKNGSYILNGTDYKVFFTTDITLLNEVDKRNLIQIIKQNI